MLTFRRSTQTNIPGAEFFFLGAPFPRAFRLRHVRPHKHPSYPNAENPQRNMFETVQLLLVVHQEVKIPELGLELLHGPYPSWVVSGEGGALEALSQDLVAGADAVGVEGGLEELAASLGSRG